MFIVNIIITKYIYIYIYIYCSCVSIVLPMVEETSSRSRYVPPFFLKVSFLTNTKCFVVKKKKKKGNKVSIHSYTYTYMYMCVYIYIFF